MDLEKSNQFEFELTELAKLAGVGKRVASKKVVDQISVSDSVSITNATVEAEGVDLPSTKHASAREDMVLATVDPYSDSILNGARAKLPCSPPMPKMMRRKKGTIPFSPKKGKRSSTQIMMTST